ncbi:MAG: hypothetical protein CMO61_05555, partial [Verrucomicrobiales bacterium]|nr:hypothetical protein [Verrucomicrobiales bacterium]
MRFLNGRTFFVAALTLVSSAVTAVDKVASKFNGADRLFALKVQPLLAEKCNGCHGEDADDVDADYNMLTREGLLAGGETFGDQVMVVGDASKSFFMEAI